MNARTISATASDTSNRFFFALAFATIVPLALLPFYRFYQSSGVATTFISAVWLVTAYGHVMSTVWFGFDTDYRPIIRQNRFRMLGSLGIISVVLAIFALSSRELSCWLFAGFLCWQAHHYNRQNFGIISFAAARDKFGILPKDVLWIIKLTTVAGAIAMVSMPFIYPGGRVDLPLFSISILYYGRIASMILMTVAALLFVRLVVANERLRRSPTTLLFLGLTTVFFLPSLIAGSDKVSFWPYAIAHGAQYLVMMSVTSGRSAHGSKGVVACTAIVVLLGIVAVSMSDVPWAQAYTGIIVWHFLADARLWRLRDPLVRTVVRNRFDFIFSPAQPVRSDHSGLQPVPVPLAA
ncbi:hypothetical protein [Sphingomonas sp.]|uniref:hypothetical protein n=1 Tax=Sphingomonas sp. TaxID=28214 RepID=UPI0035BBDE6D